MISTCSAAPVSSNSRLVAFVLSMRTLHHTKRKKKQAIKIQWIRVWSRWTKMDRIGERNDEEEAAYEEGRFRTWSTRRAYRRRLWDRTPWARCGRRSGYRTLYFSLGFLLFFSFPFSLFFSFRFRSLGNEREEKFWVSAPLEGLGVTVAYHLWHWRVGPICQFHINSADI